MQALCVFSSSEHIGKSYVRQESEGDELILREPAMKVFIDFLGNEALDLIVVDPGTDHECYIERAQVQWIVTSPRNDGAKMALIKRQYAAASRIVGGTKLYSGGGHRPQE